MHESGITRRAVLKILAFVPILGPAIAQALVSSGSDSGLLKSPYLPPSFPRWDYANDGLEEAGAWVLRIERTRLPKDFIVPVAGQIWEATQDCEVPFGPALGIPNKPKNGLSPLYFIPKTAQEMATLLSFRMRKIKLGERVRVVDVDDPRPLFVRFLPVCWEVQPKSVGPQGIENATLQLRTVRTLGDLQQRETQTYFSEVFRLVKHFS